MTVKKYSQRELNKVLTFAALLRLVLEGKSQADIARELKWSKQKTNYWFRKLEKEKLIQQENRSSTIVYGLTSKGKKFLTWSKDEPKWEIFLHHIGLKFPVLETTANFDNLNWKAVPLKNWTKKVLKYQNIDGSITIERTPENLIIWCQERVGVNPYHIFFESIRDTLQFTDSLQTKYKVRLGAPTLYCKPHFGINEPLMAIINENVQVSGPEEWTDSSPFPGSIEFFEPHRIMQYLKMPEKIENNEKVLLEITEQMKIFGDGMREHMKLISFLQELAVSLKKVVDSLQATIKITKKGERLAST
jgi:DNA-binding MarR family transcriptional regulator